MKQSRALSRLEAEDQALRAKIQQHQVIAIKFSNGEQVMDQQVFQVVSQMSDEQFEDFMDAVQSTTSTYEENSGLTTIFTTMRFAAESFNAGDYAGEGYPGAIIVDMSHLNAQYEEDVRALFFN